VHSVLHTVGGLRFVPGCSCNHHSGVARWPAQFKHHRQQHQVQVACFFSDALHSACSSIRGKLVCLMLHKQQPHSKAERLQTVKIRQMHRQKKLTSFPPLPHADTLPTQAARCLVPSGLAQTQLSAAAAHARPHCFCCCGWPRSCRRCHVHQWWRQRLCCCCPRRRLLQAAAHPP
jgi:hypothetical protein